MQKHSNEHILYFEIVLAVNCSAVQANLAVMQIDARFERTSRRTCYNFENLRKQNIQSCKLRNINYDAFRKLPSLEHIDFFDNPGKTYFNLKVN